MEECELASPKKQLIIFIFFVRFVSLFIVSSLSLHIVRYANLCHFCFFNSLIFPNKTDRKYIKTDFNNLFLGLSRWISTLIMTFKV